MKTIPWEQYNAQRITRAFPAKYEEGRFSLTQLHDAARQGEVWFRGWPFLHYDTAREETATFGKAITSVHYDARLGEQVPPFIEEWKLHRSGAILHRTVMRECYDSRKSHGRILGVIETMFHVSEAIGSLWRLYAALGVPEDEVVTIEFSYTDTSQRTLWETFESRHAILPPRGLTCHTESVDTTYREALAVWRGSDVDIATEVSREIFQQFQWDPPREWLREIITPFLGRSLRTPVTSGRAQNV